MAKTNFQRVVTFKNTLLILIVVFSVLVFYVKQFDYFEFDLIVTRAIQSFNPGWFNWLMVVVSKLGNATSGSLIMFGFIVLVLVLKQRKAALMIFIATYGGGIIAQILKQLIGRPRPSPSLINQVGLFRKSDSFPSGHVIFYVSLYGFLLFWTYTTLKKRLPLRNVLVAVFISLMILAGLSRIYLGAHWLSDVLGAYIVGLIWLMLITQLYNRFSKPQNQ